MDQADRNVFTTGLIIVLLFVGAAMVESFWSWSEFGLLLDRFFVRAGLVYFLYLLWRLVTAYERQVKAYEKRGEQGADGGVTHNA